MQSPVLCCVLVAFVGIPIINLLMYICRLLWLTLKWKVLGIPPRILDKKLVADVARVAANKSVEGYKAAAEERDVEVTKEEVDEHYALVNMLTTEIIECYIDQFTRLP